jgi:hypothetical protein
MRGAASKKPGRRTEQPAPRPEYGRGTGVPNPIDVEVGGPSPALGHEPAGACRRARSLAAMAKILAVPISYFFADLQSDGAELSIEDKTWHEQLQRPVTIELIRLFYAISNPEIRRQFLEMAKSMAEGGARSRAAGPMRPS